METQTDYTIRTMAQLRELIDEPAPIVRKKVLRELDDLSIQFIHKSPFLVLATTDNQGNLDASPKGDGPGFVLIEDRRTIVIPDRKGNKLLFGLGNIIDHPQVGLLLLLPGTGETLRVNGTAELNVDPALLERLSARGAPPQIAIRVRIEECFFHCAKAIMRSQLWNPATWQEKMSISWGRYFAEMLGATNTDMATKIDEMVEQDYKTNL